ncbi:MAG: hypothetical protein KDK34_03720 [Leptospiraceae bacterium]|nr:hypothetical protein [Leptospiraceae bacterium]
MPKGTGPGCLALLSQSGNGNLTGGPDLQCANANLVFQTGSATFNWTAVPDVGVSGLRDIAYNNGRFLAVGNSGVPRSQYTDCN